MTKKEFLCSYALQHAHVVSSLGGKQNLLACEHDKMRATREEFLFD